MGEDFIPIFGSMQYPHMIYFRGNNPNMDILQIIAANIDAINQRAGSLDSLKEVARKASIGYGTVQRAASGDGNFTIKKLEGLAKALGVHVTELLIAPDDIYRKKIPDKTLSVTEPKVVDLLRKMEHPAIAQVENLMKGMTDRGKQIALEHVRLVASEHALAKTNRQ